MIQREEYFYMSDGTRLYTRIQLPEGEGTFPIVFQRTPYGSDHHWWSPEECEPFLRHGYALVQQHVRGSGGSEGDMVPYREQRDGLESLAILRTLPFYNGEIYVTGSSYGATAHLCYLSKQPPDVRAAVLGIQQDSMYSWAYRNGCCRGYCGLSWFAQRLLRRYPDQISWQEELSRPYETLMERIMGEDVPEYTGRIVNDTYNDFWKERENERVADTLQIPLLLLDGWFDYYTAGMFDMWRRLPEDTRKRSAFAVGPWGHATRTEASEYPLRNANLPADIAAQFFDSVRLGTDFDLPLGQVSYHTVTDGCWRTDAGCSIRERRLYFRPDGVLGEFPGAAEKQSYRYDPGEPLNFYRHNVLYPRPTETPAGVVTFLSEPAEEDTEIYGTIRWSMPVESDCEDTAFFARLSFEEDGTAWNLTETVTALSHQAPDYEPGQVRRITVEMTPVGFLWKKGMRLRVDISSHSDLYVPHANMRGHWAKVTETKTAVNTLWMGEDAYISLPVREDRSGREQVKR